MSVKFFNRPELGLALGSIEVLDLLHAPVRVCTSRSGQVGHLFLNSVLERLQLAEHLSAVELGFRLLVANVVELLPDLRFPVVA